MSQDNASTVVIVGSGLAAYTLAREFRKLDPDAPMHILTRDSGRAYSKPMLSNAIAKNKTADELAMKSAAETAEQLGATIAIGVEVTAIDRARSVVVTTQGETPYGRLVLALGADQIVLPLEGNAVADIVRVNDLEEYGQFRAALDGSTKRVTVLGAGLIGCEFANDLCPAGHSVHIVDLAEWPLSRFVPREMGVALRDALATQGIDWHLGTTMVSVDRNGGGFTCRLASGTTLDSDIVLSAVGLRSRIGLAQAAGLKVARGIYVNDLLQSSDPNIYALGDCAEVNEQVLPFVMPLMTCARALAATLAGTPTPVVYPPMPVILKTPALPTVVLPPEPGTQGSWSLEGTPPNLTARFRNSAGQTLGFALTGTATSTRPALVKELPA